MDLTDLGKWTLNFTVWGAWKPVYSKYRACLPSPTMDIHTYSSDWGLQEPPKVGEHMRVIGMTDRMLV